MSKKKRTKFIRPLRLIRGNIRKAGMPPGTVCYTGDVPSVPVKVVQMDYDAATFKEQTVKTIEEVFESKTTATTTWINIDGISDTALVEKIGKQFDLHPLVLEDIVVPSQRPKLEDFDHYLYIVARMLRYDHTKNEIQNEQISMILCNNCLITFQESVGDMFDPIRDRLRTNKGKLRKMGADYLAYCLIDAISDHCFAILENYGEKVEILEDELLSNPGPNTLGRIHEFKRDLTMLRKSVWPMRELAAVLQRSDNELITQSTKLYLRDLYDHTVQVIDTIESLRDIVASLLEIYLSSISNKMNSIMKVLTGISTIFMPLSFVASVYGMNFDYFPELRCKWFYPYAFWGIISVMVTTMVIFYRRQKWL